MASLTSSPATHTNRMQDITANADMLRVKMHTRCCGGQKSDTVTYPCRLGSSLGQFSVFLYNNTEGGKTEKPTGHRNLKC